jgi:Flp pilus assembly protein TadB
MDDHMERWRDPEERLPALVDYLKGDQIKRAVESGRPIINITINEAPRPAPPPPPEPDIATKYAGHMILATWSLIVLAGVAVIFVLIAGAFMTMMISVAVCALAGAAAIRSLRMSKTEARHARMRDRERD